MTFADIIARGIIEASLGGVVLAALFEIAKMLREPLRKMWED